MNKSIKRIIRWLAITMILFMVFPSGILAEALVNRVNQASETETQDNQSAPLNETFSPGNEVTPQIETFEQLPNINQDENLDQQIVVIYKNSGTDNIKELSLTTDKVVAGEQVSSRVDLLEVSDQTSVDAMVADLKKNPNVLAVSKNDKIEVSDLPNDPYVMDGSEWQFQRIGVDQIWDKVLNREPVVVAVIDTGLNVNHPDLIEKAVTGYDFVTNQINVVDLAGHGTAVSGCIAATANNGVGAAGIAGLSNIKIAPYRVGGKYLGDTQLDVAYICAALLKAAERPEVKVINLSFGGYGTFPTLAAAINEAIGAGKVIVAAAGNEGESWNAKVGEYAYPASYDHVISVGATNKDNTRASFSQYNDQVDLCAPGKSVLTTAKSGGYEYVSGTSFASPIVAGACAVLLAKDASLNSEAVESILKTTALDLGKAGSDSYYGSGLVQLNTAIASIISATTVSSTYRTHVQNIGWQGWRKDGQIGGTFGQAQRLEGIEIKINSGGADIGVSYQTDVQNVGWQGWKSDGQTSGTAGQSLRLEAIQIKLTGSDAADYDIYYRTHAQNYGWLDWAKNGESSGTQGKSLRLEAIEIRVVPKDDPAPGSTERPFVN